MNSLKNVLDRCKDIIERKETHTNSIKWLNVSYIINVYILSIIKNCYLNRMYAENLKHSSMGCTRFLPRQKERVPLAIPDEKLAFYASRRFRPAFDSWNGPLRQNDPVESN